MLQQLQFSQAIHQHLPAEVRFTLPQGGYFLWVQLPAQKDGLKLFRQAIAHNISLAPGHMFSSQQQYACYIRLNYGHPFTAANQHAIETLGQFIRRD